jgi:hypothetical protein
MNILKVVLFFFTTILILFLLWFFWLYDFKGEKIYIKKGYIGEVRIFYDRKNGLNVCRDDNGSIIYEIPKSGVLYVNFKDYISRGTPIGNKEYFLVGNDGIEKFIEYDIGMYSTKYYQLVDFQYYSDSLASNGVNYYSERFIVARK